MRRIGRRRPVRRLPPARQPAPRCRQPRRAPPGRRGAPAVRAPLPRRGRPRSRRRRAAFFAHRRRGGDAGDREVARGDHRPRALGHRRPRRYGCCRRSRARRGRRPAARGCRRPLQTISMPWRTMLRMPPRRRPGERSWLMKCTGTVTVTCAPAPTRMKSTWSAASLTGSYCTSRGRVRCVVPSTATSTSVAKNPGLRGGARQLARLEADQRSAPCRRHRRSPGTRPARRVARAGALAGARSRGSALRLMISGMNGHSFTTRMHRPRVRLARGAGRGGIRGQVEQARNRALLADPQDRLGHQRRDRQLPDVVRQPHRLGRDDAVGQHQRLDRRRRRPAPPRRPTARRA